MKACFKTKKDREVEYKDMGTAFMRNGGMVLEKLIGFCNGKSNPILGFSAEELKRATNNYEERQVLYDKGWFKLYKGFLQDRPILVKKYEDKDKFEDSLSCAINEIPYASHMSIHKNVLKLLGCCLDTEVPILVFESVKYGTLDNHLHSPNNAHFQPLLWKQRLKIAVDIANVVAYLHTAFPKPIIHRHIKPRNILLDEHCVAKLTDFSLSISIPDGESRIVVDRVIGTYGYIAPEYAIHGHFNEKYDVYSFGASLLVLLTGKKPYDFINFVAEDNEASDASSYDADNEARVGLSYYLNKVIKDNRFNEIVDPRIVEEGPWLGKDKELQSFAALALRCISETEDNRPAMIDVAKELRQMYRSGISPV